MIKTSWIEQVRWIKPKPERESPIHEDRIGRWWWTGEPDKAWGLEQMLGNGPAQVEKVAKTWLFRDPRGDYHETIRELFSTFRLGRCRCDRMSDPVEKMRHVLEALDKELHVRQPEKMVEKTFDGSRAYLEDYLQYLELEQIVTCEGRSITDLRLSAEGQSILLMLRLSAPRSNYDCSPGATLRRAMEAQPHRFKKSIEDIEW